MTLMTAETLVKVGVTQRDVNEQKELGWATFTTMMYSTLLELHGPIIPIVKTEEEYTNIYDGGNVIEGRYLLKTGEWVFRDPDNLLYFVADKDEQDSNVQENRIGWIMTPVSTQDEKTLLGFARFSLILFKTWCHKEGVTFEYSEVVELLEDCKKRKIEVMLGK